MTHAIIRPFFTVLYMRRTSKNNRDDFESNPHYQMPDNFLTPANTTMEHTADVLHEKKSESATKEKTYTGIITAGARRRIVKAYSTLADVAPTYWLYSPVVQKRVKHKLTLITLTYPNSNPPEIEPYLYTHCLKRWLRAMREKHGMGHYIWRAERTKKGRIHYHITTNLFVAWWVARDEWHNVLRNNQIDHDFFNNRKPKECPSTECKEVVSQKDMGLYMAKYISKNDDEDNPIPGKLWDVSRTIKLAPSFTTPLTPEVYDKFWQFQIDNKNKVRDGLFYRLYFAPSRVFSDFLPRQEVGRMNDIREAVLNHDLESAHLYAAVR